MDPKLELTPLKPSKKIPQLSKFPELAKAQLFSYNVRTRAFPPRRLEDYYQSDKLEVNGLRYWGENLSEPEMSFSNSGAFQVNASFDWDFWGHERDILAVLEVETDQGLAIQVFVGSELQSETAVNGRDNIPVVFPIVPNASIVVRPRTPHRLTFYRAMIYII